MTFNQVSISLSWRSTDDLDLGVFEPNGDHLYYNNPSTPSGGVLSSDLNPDPDNTTSSPVETIYWTNGALPGTYQIEVSLFARHPSDSSGPIGYNLSLSAEDVSKSFSTTTSGESDFYNLLLGDNNNNLLTGSTSDDYIYGFSGSDNLIGGDGNDELVGTGLGLGVGEIDSLTGGTGRDTFVLGSKGNVFYSGSADLSGFTPLTTQQLKEIMTGAKQENVDKYTPLLNEYMKLFNINTPLRQAAFLAQVAVETDQLKDTEEDLIYKTGNVPARLASLFPRVFGKDREQAVKNAKAFVQGIGNKDEKVTTRAEEMALANKIYGTVNGNKKSGDGWRFRGRGLIQITGRGNYIDVENKLKEKGINSQLVALMERSNPDLLPDALSVSVSTAFWDMNNLNSLADEGKFRALTKKVNTKLEKYSDRLNYYKRSKEVLLNRDSYALIKDFNPIEDSILLSGSMLDYSFKETSINIPSLNYQSGLSLTYKGDQIAIIQGNTQGLFLAAGYFQFN